MMLPLWRVLEAWDRRTLQNNPGRLSSYVSTNGSSVGSYPLCRMDFSYDLGAT